MVAEAVEPPSTSARARRIGQGPAFAYFEGDDDAKARGLFRILQEDGTCEPNDVARFDEALTRRLYEGMLTIRVMDERLLALQRQGRVSFYGEARGQEASVVGSAVPMEPHDWLVPALREAGAGIVRGMSLDSYVAQIYGNANDVTKGRQMPCHPCDKANNYVVMSSCVASQVPHAVGIAMAMKARGDKGKVCVGYMGDGGTSEGDFHVAINFAGVFKAPVVLVCQNNQWAISTPGTIQTAAETIALKGIGYGVEALRADGNDVFAVYEVMKYALDKARRGEGPTFVELLTYRVSAHSSSDDPSRYRDEDVTAVWRDQRDPIARVRRFMESRGWLDAAGHERLAASIEANLREVIARQEAAGNPGLDTLVTDVYEEPTWLLREQLEAFRKGE
ncbi:MAG TPA: thiamine pyrophosphate-dependent enzyme [Kofleriaceae bacterium]|nr:thiamine pyrophosphate-dependent enzyme [Kofleriaceae bacterium]